MPNVIVVHLSVDYMLDNPNLCIIVGRHSYAIRYMPYKIRNDPVVISKTNRLMTSLKHTIIRKLLATS